jgi:hypothetical protein
MPPYLELHVVVAVPPLAMKDVVHEFCPSLTSMTLLAAVLEHAAIVCALHRAICQYLFPLRASLDGTNRGISRVVVGMLEKSIPLLPHSSAQVMPATVVRSTVKKTQRIVMTDG